MALTSLSLSQEELDSCPEKPVNPTSPALRHNIHARRKKTLQPYRPAVLAGHPPKSALSRSLRRHPYLPGHPVKAFEDNYWNQAFLTASKSLEVSKFLIAITLLNDVYLKSH
jgi:hypothetical protein